MSAQKSLLGAHTIKQAMRLMKANVFTAPELCNEIFSNMDKQAHLNAFVNYRDRDTIIEEAEAAQHRIEKNQQLSPLDGIPIAIKDNINVEGMQTSAASLILKDFIAPVDSTAVAKLRAAGAILVGSCNMDEMGMGSFSLYGYEGKMVHNPIDNDYFCGGSSGGSASAVASKQALGALGTDTGGSVNYPAHCCGLYSMKPSYGRISRFGQVLYSSSNETTGPMANSIWDVHQLFHTMQGPDHNDAACIDFSKLSKIRYLDRVMDSSIEAPGILNGLRVGVLDEFHIDELDERNRRIQNMAIEMLQDQGAIIKRISVPLMKYCLPFYFTLVPAEAATNLSRFDGLRYGNQPDFAPNEEVLDYVMRVRSENLGLNVKRRCMLGNFLLSSKFEGFNERVRQAQKVRRMFIEQWCNELERNDIDVVISPTTIGEEPTRIDDIIGAKDDDDESQSKGPVYEFKMDYYTAFPNSLGIPSITLPVQETWGKDPETGAITSGYKFPSSIKICSYFGEDYHLLRIAKQMQHMLETNGVNVDAS